MRFIIVFLLLAVWIPEVAAQTKLRDEQRQLALPVPERLPQELRNEGMNYHGFIYQPSLEIQGRYDDNILVRPNSSSDYILAIKPRINVIKKYDAHSLIFGADGHIERFAERSEENKEDFGIYARGEIAANSRWSFPFSVGYRERARKRSNPQSIISNEPLDIQSFDADFGAVYHFNRLSMGIVGEYRDVSFDDGRALTGTTPAIFSDDDRQEYRAKLTTRYKLPDGNAGRENAPSHILFADFIYGRQEYEKNEFIGGRFAGDSGDRDEWGFLAGIESNYEDRLFTNLAAGYMYQSFDDADLGDIDELDLSVRIAWSIRPKLTLNFEAMRDINQDSGFTQGIIETGATFGADYELLHNLYVGGDIAYTDYDFEGSTREDEDLTAALDLRYYNSRRLETALEARWQDRESNIPANEFDRVVFLLSMTGKL